MNTIDKARIAQKISHKYVGQFQDDFFSEYFKGDNLYSNTNCDVQFYLMHTNL